MTTSPSINSNLSVSSESIQFGTSSGVSHDSTALVISNVVQISALLEDMRMNKSQWAIGDQLGIAYYFIGDRLYKQSNVITRAGIRNKQEVRNQEQFFDKLGLEMLQKSTSFVEVQLCGKADAFMMYCHSKLQRLEPKRRVLLLGKVVFVQGHVNNYYTQPTEVATGTRVKLYGRTFNIRVSSNQHSIHLRVEDIIKNRVRLEPLQPLQQQQTGEEGAATALAVADDDSTDLDDGDISDGDEFDRDSDTDAGSDTSRTGSPAATAGRAARIRTVRGRRMIRNRIAIAEAAAAAVVNATNDNATTVRAATGQAADGPELLLPGGIRLMLLRDAQVQTGDNDVPNAEEGNDADLARPQRPHSF